MSEATIESEIVAYAKRKKSEENRKYREEHYEVVLARSREWARKNLAEIKADPEKREEFRARKRQYYQDHKQEFSNYGKKYYQKHKEEIRARQNRYNAEHREQQREYKRKRREYEHDRVRKEEDI